MNTAFGYVAFVTSLWLGLSSLPALVIATVAGVVFNFQTSRTLVFRGQPGVFGRFALVYSLLLLLNWAALSGLEKLGTPAWIGQALLTLPLALVSFSLQLLVVFARPEAA